MKKLLILGSNSGAVEVVKKARSMGIYTIVTDYLPVEGSSAKPFADAVWQLSTGDLDALEVRCREEHIDGVLAGASDFNQEMSIALCERLGLPSYCSMTSWHYSRDKADFKKICRQINAPIPEEYTCDGHISTEDLKNVPLPAIVKPIDLAGNRGVSYCYTLEDLQEACQKALALSKSKKLVVERMLSGEEWIVYYAMADGEVSLLGMNRDIPQQGMQANANCITTTITDHIGQYLEEMNHHVIRMLKAMQCREGLCWVQVMRDRDGKFYIIEMGYRFGGDVIFIPYDVVRDFDGLKWIIECALGVQHKPEELPAPQTGPFEKCACVYSLWPTKDGIFRRFEGLEKYREDPAFVVYTSLKEGDSYSAYTMKGILVFAAENCEQMCRIIEQINEDVRLIDTQGENVLLYYRDTDYLKSLY